MEGDEFHKFEVVDRAHMVFTHLCEALEDHPMVTRDPEIQAAYERARAALWLLYDVAGRKYLLADTGPRIVTP